MQKELTLDENLTALVSFMISHGTVHYFGRGCTTKTSHTTILYKPKGRLLVHSSFVPANLLKYSSLKGYGGKWW